MISHSGQSSGIQLSQASLKVESLRALIHDLRPTLFLVPPVPCGVLFDPHVLSYYPYEAWLFLFKKGSKSYGE